MKEYITTLIYISVFSIILEMILPNSKLKKYITSIISLFVVIVTITPVINLFKSENILETLSETISNMDIQEYNETSTYDFSKYSNNMVSKSVKEKIEEDIYTKCKSAGFDILNVKLVLEDNYEIEEINVYVSKLDTVEKAKEIIRYITDTYNVKEQNINVIKGE